MILKLSATLALLAAALLAPQAPAVAEAASCNGLPATIESTSPGGPVTGTEGPDVIVATSVGPVDALGGDDTICVAAGSYVKAGAGDDSVFVTSVGAHSNIEQADLGPGVNHYSSVGPTNDTVVSGSPGEPNLDTIDLGAAGDSLVATLPPGSDLHADGGPEVANSVTIMAQAGDEAPWDVQLGGAVTHGGVHVASIAHIDFLSLAAGPDATVTVHGTPDTDGLTVDAGTLQADLGDGDDVANVGPLVTAGHVDLGAGLNHLQATWTDRVPSEVVLDLRKGTLGSIAVAGVTSSFLVARRVSFTGTSSRDFVTAYGCRAVLRGGAGADEFLAVPPDSVPGALGCAPRLRELGGAGRDRMFGSKGPDVLLGGRGHDFADGRGGRDRCRAEQARNCE